MDKITSKNLVKTFVKEFALLCTEHSLYPAQHPSVLAQTKQTFSAAEAILSIIELFYIDIEEGQFAFEGIPLYEIRHIVEKTAQLLDSKKINTICFKRGITPQEITSFILFAIKTPSPQSHEQLQAALQKSGVTSIVLEKAHLSTDVDTDSTTFIPPEKIYGSSVETNKSIIKAIQEGKKIPVDLVNKISKDITDMISKDMAASIALTTLKDYDDYTYTHSTNVAILSVILAKSIFDNEQLLKDLARAALLHDVGKTLLPIEIIQKPGKLDDREWKIIRQHPVLGAKILEQQDPVHTLSVIIAAQHHIKFDFSGYPGNITNLHPLTLIVNICDVYDAITSRRPYKDALQPDKALALMMSLVGCDFDPRFFKVFTHMLGIYPPGSFVLLSTSEIAVVRTVNPLALLLPEVKIIRTADEKTMFAPKIINLFSKEDNPSGITITEVIEPRDHGIDPLLFL
ncbi:MAG: HD-GYP domain-containing protein [Candidatus Omnitrophota bacterium]